MPVAGALIAAGGSIIGGQTASRAQDRATRASERSEQRAIDAQLSMYQQQRQDQMPWLQAGSSSLAQIARILGLPTQGAAAGAGSAAATSGIDPAERARRLQIWQQFNDYRAGARENPEVWRAEQLAANPWLSTFDPNSPASDIGAGQPSTIPAPSTPFDMTALLRSTPGYQFAAEEGMQDIERSAAARGGLNSGGTLRALSRYRTGLADQTFNNYLNRLFSVAGLGQSATGQIGAAGQATGGNIAQNLSNIGAARSSGYANQGNIWGNAVGGVANAFGQYYGNRPQTTAVGGSGPINQNAWMQYGYGGGG